MGMNRGKVIKGAKQSAKRATPKAKGKTAAPRVVTKTKVVTKTVEVDRNRALRALAQRIVDVTLANDDAASLALYADSIESREANTPPSVGIDAIKQKFEMWRGMTSSASFTPRSIAVDGNTIVIEWEGRVTLAASGRVVDLNEVAVHEIDGGKIVKERFYYDPSVLQG
jgi:ketosteroid isomerase-like protein